MHCGVPLRGGPLIIQGIQTGVYTLPCDKNLMFSPGSRSVLVVASYKGECLEASLAQIVALSAQRPCIGKVFLLFQSV